MGWLQLRNVKAKSSHTVDAEGAVFGRDAAEADIVLADKSVSKRHARVFAKGGKWFLEDLGSSNGTFFDGKKLTAAVPLNKDDLFSVAAFTFEVADIGDGDGPSDDGEAKATSTATNVKPLAKNDPEKAVPLAGRQRAAPAPEDDLAAESAPPAAEDQPPTLADDKEVSKQLAAAKLKAEKAKKPEAKPEKNEKAAKPEKPKKAAKADDDDDAPADDGEMDGDPKDPKFYLKALPRGIAFHLATIPLLVLNPPGTIRKSVEKQKLPALKWPGLIVYALPAQLFSAAVTFVCSLLAQIIVGTVSIGSIIPIVPLIVAVVSSVIGGLVAHPVLTWVVDKLKGESNEKQRTNYFVIQMSLVALTAVPGGLGILMGALAAKVNFPLLNVVPMVLSLAVSLIGTFLAYSWFTEFNVVKWFRQVILALGALAVLGTAWGLVGTVIATVRTIGSGSSSASTSGSTTDATEAAEEAKEKAEKAAEEAKEKAEEKAEKAEKAAEEAKEKTEEKAEKKPAKAADEPKEKKGKKGDKKAEEKAAKAEKKAEEKAEKAEEKAEKVEEKAEDKSAMPATDYVSYAAHRDEVEKAIAANPMLLKKVPGLMALYEKYHRTAYGIRSAGGGGGGKDKKKGGGADPALEPVRERLREIEVYEKTAAVVEEMHAKVK